VIVEEFSRNADASSAAIGARLTVELKVSWKRYFGDCSEADPEEIDRRG